MTGRQIMLPYSEIRIANCFRGVELSTEDIAEMQRRIIAENKSWLIKKKRQENTGSSDEKEAERHRRKSKWMKRELSEAEKLQLQSAWGI